MWHTRPGLLYSKVLTDIDSTKSYVIAGFDLDGTIIKPLNRRPFPINRDDWTFINENVEVKMTNLPNNVIPVIFTNQLGITKGKQKKDDIVGKISDIVERFGWKNYMVYVSILDDEYRKPRTGMWKKMLTHLIKANVSVNKYESYYVGDALGRKTPRDHSDSDLKFANNIGIKCHSPESYFG